MKKTVLLPLMALLVLFGFTSPVVAEESMEDMEKRCRGYAVEDEVPADELDTYMKECVDGILRENAGAPSEEASGSESEGSKE
jgi:hypothetical protein